MWTMNGPNLVLKPKSQNDLGLKSSIQWICREWVRKLNSNELDNNYDGPRWLESKDKQVLSKENHHWHNPRKCVLIYIYIYIYIYISLLNLITSLIPVFTVFFFSIPLIKIFFLFYTVFLLSSPPSTCRLGFWCWSLSHQHLLEVSGNSCKVENYCSSITSTLMRLKS